VSEKDEEAQGLGDDVVRALEPTSERRGRRCRERDDGGKLALDMDAASAWSSTNAMAHFAKEDFVARSLPPLARA
jgi:hypothetical protein